MEILSDSIEITKETAQDFLTTIQKGDKAIVVGLKGNLGSGKTTFVKCVGEILGLEQTLTSPTFVIEKIYKLENQVFNHLIHIDAYRLSSGEELLSLGIAEVLRDPRNLIFVEWPENVQSVLPQEMKHINFEFINDTTRKITY